PTLLLFDYPAGAHRALHSFPTRRSSDLYLTNDPRDQPAPLFQYEPVVVEFTPPQNLRPAELGLILDESADTKDVTATIVDLAVRSEEHTSELQSPCNLVCRLLLEKKKNV